MAAGGSVQQTALCMGRGNKLVFSAGSVFIILVMDFRHIGCCLIICHMKILSPGKWFPIVYHTPVKNTIFLKWFIISIMTMSGKCVKICLQPIYNSSNNGVCQAL